jgi:hypothetical protein
VTNGNVFWESVLIGQPLPTGRSKKLDMLALKGDKDAEEAFKEVVDLAVKSKDTAASLSVTQSVSEQAADRKTLLPA